MKNKKITVSLSGGGLRSVAGLGAIKYLEDNGYVIKSISGTSGGAIISYLYGLGMEVEDILYFIRNFDKKKIFRPTIKSIFSLNELERKLKEETKLKKTFKKRIVICTTDLETGKPVYFDSEKVSKGKMIRAVIASSSIIPFFGAVKINDRYFVDGGYTDNLPNIVFEGERNIAVNVNNVSKEISFSPIKLTTKLLLTVMNSNIKEAAKRADHFINVDTLSEMHLFEFKNMEFAYNEGYRLAKESFELDKKDDLFKIEYFKSSL